MYQHVNLLVIELVEVVVVVHVSIVVVVLDVQQTVTIFVDCLALMLVQVVI